MDKNTKKEVEHIVGIKHKKRYQKKEVSIIKDEKQFSIRVPTKFVEAVGLDKKKHSFEFTLIPNENGKEFTIEAKLKEREVQ